MFFKIINEMTIKLHYILVLTLFFNCVNESQKSISIKSINAIGKTKKIEFKSEDVRIFDENLIDAKKVVIPPDIFNSKMDLSNLIYDIELIPLESTSESLIGEIYNILYDANFYFIHDKRNNKLLRFSENGKFLNSIGEIGKGPRELLKIGDVSINSDKKIVSILDSKSRKISRFKYSGEFIDSLPLYYMVSEHEYGNNSLVFAVSRVQKNSDIPLIESNGLIIADINSIPLSLAFKIPENSFVYTTKRTLRKFNNSIYYHQPFSNGIWKVEEDSIIPLIKFEFEKNGFPDDGWKKQISTERFRELLDEYVCFSGEFLMSNNISFFKFFKKEEVSNVFFNKKSGNIIYGKGFVFTKDNPSMLLYRSPKGIGKNNSFVAEIDPVSLISYRNVVENNKIKNHLASKYWDIIKSIKQTDNPLIVTFKLKDF